MTYWFPGIWLTVILAVTYYAVNVLSSFLTIFAVIFSLLFLRFGETMKPSHQTHVSTLPALQLSAKCSPVNDTGQ